MRVARCRISGLQTLAGAADHLEETDFRFFFTQPTSPPPPPAAAPPPPPRGRGARAARPPAVAYPRSLTKEFKCPHRDGELLAGLSLQLPPAAPARSMSDLALSPAASAPFDAHLGKSGRCICLEGEDRDLGSVWSADQLAVFRPGDASPSPPDQTGARMNAVWAATASRPNGISGGNFVSSSKEPHRAGPRQKWALRPVRHRARARKSFHARCRVDEQWAEESMLARFAKPIKWEERMRRFRPEIS